MMRKFVAPAVVSVLALTLSGCMWETGSGTLGTIGQPTLSGSVTGTPVTGSFSGLSGNVPGCSTAGVSLTLIDANGTVTLVMCPLPGAPVGTGPYTVTGGTGAYAGATGNGAFSLQVIEPCLRAPCLNIAVALIGAFDVPSTVPAASTVHKNVSARKPMATGKHTVRMRVKISPTKAWCNSSGRCTLNPAEKRVARLLHRLVEDH